MEFGFMAGVHTAGGEGPPLYVAKLEILVDADTQDEAEEMASDRMNEILADGFILDQDLVPV